MAEAGVKTMQVPAAHPVFAGHFPGRPIVPGVMLLEWVVDELGQSIGRVPGALRVRECKFFTALCPEQRAELRLEVGETRCTFDIRLADASIARGVVEWGAHV